MVQVILAAVVLLSFALVAYAIGNILDKNRKMPTSSCASAKKVSGSCGCGGGGCQNG